MKIQDQTCILGIKVSGLSFKIDTLTLNADQSEYDYICDVSSSSYNKGNGSFSISIMDKNCVQGLKMGKWTLLKGSIVYDWGVSYASFIMLDEENNETHRIKAAKSRGATAGFDIEGLTRSIFTEAREIVQMYPSAKIYNCFTDFMDEEIIKNLKLSIYDPNGTLKEMNEKFYYYTLKPMQKYMEQYNEIVKLLSGSEDIRCQRLLAKVMDKCNTNIRWFLKE